ncbi:hypothetical protein SAMN05192545_2880 [Maribacter dokdonensis]|uniref:Uncharacterized protein n=1 Tax=Maribacter dokdonensis TaxID=320912 RepID=A0ABY0UTC3_9FLAO|nr:hypothetical protein [Maribacter dokdonensis]SDT15029.1 hypothetical protein SAMN05192545_2880 [Maribacter dokdonensis]
MSKKITLKITDAQLNATISMMDNVAAGVGCSDSDKESIHQLRLMVRMLRNNGIEPNIINI